MSFRHSILNFSGFFSITSLKRDFNSQALNRASTEGVPGVHAVCSGCGAGSHTDRQQQSEVTGQHLGFPHPPEQQASSLGAGRGRVGLPAGSAAANSAAGLSDPALGSGTALHSLSRARSAGVSRTQQEPVTDWGNEGEGK